jgi:hypothetical protein
MRRIPLIQRNFLNLSSGAQTYAGQHRRQLIITHDWQWTERVSIPEGLIIWAASVKKLSLLDD